MRLPLSIFTIAVALLSGCASPTIIETREPTTSMTPEPAESPKDGKILVMVSGNAKERGWIWVREDASLATIEDLFAVRPEWASRSITIVRRDGDGQKWIRCRIAKMSRSEKEKIKVHHGDAVCFVWDRCFGFAPARLGEKAEARRGAMSEIPLCGWTMITPCSPCARSR